MATQEQLAIVRQGVDVWNRWRKYIGQGGSQIKINLSGANLSHINLSGADLSGADLTRANLAGADLTEATLSWVDTQYPVISPKEKIKPLVDLSTGYLVGDDTLKSLETSLDLIM